jgi:2-C-methyl-D-erythritol 4-phosphate cytidylyltransferase
MKEFALIVAGGKGTRIKSELPKQFIELNGKPILLHTIEAFIRYSSSRKILKFGKRSAKNFFSTNQSFCKKAAKQDFNQ